MNFDDAMTRVEDALAFPAPPHLHPRRLAWILDRSGLNHRARQLPWALVAGSCGKASTARMLAFVARRLLDLAGVDAPVALGTKPPLSETHDGQRERYQLLLAGERRTRWIARDDFARHVAALLPHADALAREAPALGPLAPYDLRYAVLLAHALDAGAALAVVEANIGLRDDPTAALPPPRAQLLTPVDTDHAMLLRPPSPLHPALEGLGDRAGPVWHKAGGLRPGVPVVVGLQDAPVARAVEALARERGAAPLRVRGRDWDVLRRRCALDGSDATLRVGDATLDVRVTPVGDFQVDNAAHAAAAARALLDAGALPGDEAAWRDAVAWGLREVTTPGRMEVLSRAPLTLLQVGASAVKMRAFVEAFGALLPPGGRAVACASFLARIHDAHEPALALARAPWLEALVVTSCAREGDAADLEPEALRARLAAACPSLRVVAAANPDEALDTARREALDGGHALALVGNGLGARLAPPPM